MGCRFSPSLCCSGGWPAKGVDHFHDNVQLLPTTRAMPPTIKRQAVGLDRRQRTSAEPLPIFPGIRSGGRKYRLITPPIGGPPHGGNQMTFTINRKDLLSLPRLGAVPFAPSPG